jgi:hypothetical protein
MSFGESPKCTVVAQNMAETRRNLHQLLKGKKLYSALCSVCTEVQHNFTIVLKETAAERRNGEGNSRNTSDNSQKITRNQQHLPLG